MSSKLTNPHSDYQKLGWEMLEFSDPDLSYEFDMLCFWKVDSRMVFSASDSGCSCPIPFEDYDGDTPEEIMQKLERVGSVRQGEAIFDAWNKKDYVSAGESPNKVPQEQRDRLHGWLIDALFSGALHKGIGDL